VRLGLADDGSRRRHIRYPWAWRTVCAHRAETSIEIRPSAAGP
jgi:hypothetical protein